MWLKVLKYAVKAAVASGLADKAVGYLKDKLGAAAKVAKDKLVKKFDQIEEDSKDASK